MLRRAREDVRGTAQHFPCCKTSTQSRTSESVTQLTLCSELPLWTCLLRDSLFLGLTPSWGREAFRRQEEGDANPCYCRPFISDPMDCSPPGSSAHGILQARILKWVAFPFSRGIFPTQRLNLGLLHCRRILYCLSHQGSSLTRDQTWAPELGAVQS